jgi:hypothetical protein
MEGRARVTWRGRGRGEGDVVWVEDYLDRFERGMAVMRAGDVYRSPLRPYIKAFRAKNLDGCWY